MRMIKFKLKRSLARWTALLACMISTVSFVAAQSNTPCPTVTTSSATALLAAAEACLQPSGRLHERNAAQALVYVRQSLAIQIATHVELARAYDLQAQAHFWLGEKGQAIASQTQALLLLPTADRYLQRAELMDFVGDTTGAIADAEEAIVLAPRQLETYLWLGRYALENAEYELALDVMERAIPFAPDNSDVALLQGDVHYARGDYAAAQTAYERYLTLEENVSPVVVARLRVIERSLGN